MGKKNAGNARLEKAQDTFNKHFETIYGEERWAALQPAMLGSTRHCALLNQFVEAKEVKATLGVEDKDAEPLPFVSIPCVVKKEHDERTSTEHPFNPPKPSTTNGSRGGLRTHYLMDAASVLVTEALNVTPGLDILDLCAAPGGKSIAIAQQLFPHLHAGAIKPEHQGVKIGTLHANEMNPARRKRLRGNLEEYLPAPLFEKRKITATEHDGTKTLHFPTSHYDRVLLDAPCGSERHILHSVYEGGDEMIRWKPKASKEISAIQLELLETAVKVVKPGGLVVYATCSISPEENDDVVRSYIKRLKKRNERFKAMEAEKGEGDKYEQSEVVGRGVSVIEVEVVRRKEGFAIGEKTRYGHIVLPDTEGRWGPLYFSILRRTS
ncbi:S-adenosyl-L-methionine-dependent methyltransferase [Saitoella complicata NRRL Y-17804]|uniref:NOL1/NOP2/Sun domain family member 4 n=1 Tax=Saitoella complicata (strain BCRC 22490 / CBS 7301 / JCM 7358 / NBRC 10748 / NRRL Y-17804) TaxID=698492 RepID=A0A0E9NT63_SAICN|nr:S-adenosyl-L-methionine-dependent methyltransferase [Saitoella complicata NRRL Y-17804]ODQ49964.1 S-adenosyl-L-methionine-dependent methyltransferase [Saitoella complicata NRRL Y-17804]GAO52605.1 hypothetical protein G7K_6678-t1 [Saitoella complicata NRRL Y-17804]